MINLILILLLIHYSLFLLSRNRFKNSNLNCGIFGWFGKTPTKFNKDKFDKLGIYNVERGKTSCGISVDGELFIGIGTEKIYSDFIKNRDITPKQFPYVLGHTRNASPGMPVTADNVHPFGFGSLNNSETYEFIGVHNGTVYNSKELAEKYNVEQKETKVVFNQFNVKTEETRSKIDSELLLEILYNSKNFKALSEYNGTAALVFINLNEPDSVWVWKGASRNYTNAASPIVEERPLFYFQETQNSLYISSIEDSLLTIGGKKDENTFSFAENTIYKIKNGNVSKAELIRVSRKEALQKESFNNFNDYDEVNMYYDAYKKRQSQSRNFMSNCYRNNQGCKIKTDNTLNIFSEKLVRDVSEYGKRPYFFKLRYLRNGHPVEGIFTWISGYGFFDLASGSFNDAENTLKTYVGKSFKNGNFELNKKITLIDDFVPFESDFNIGENIHFFVEGVKVKTHTDFAVLLAKKRKYPLFELNVRELSHCSEHPVCRISKVTPSVNFQDVMYEGVDFTGSIVPLGSEKRYRFNDGKLVEEVPLLLGSYRMGFHNKPVKEESVEIVEPGPKPVTVTTFPALVNDDEDYNKQGERDVELLIDKIEEESSEVLITVEDLLETIKESGLSEHVKIKKLNFYLKAIENRFHKLTETPTFKVVE